VSPKRVIWIQNRPMKTTHDLTEAILRQYFLQHGYTQAKIDLKLAQYRQLFADVMAAPKPMTDTEYAEGLKQANQEDTEFVVRLLKTHQSKPPSNLFGENN
jgi:hypothetical protein